MTENVLNFESSLFEIVKIYNFVLVLDICRIILFISIRQVLFSKVTKE